MMGLSAEGVIGAVGRIERGTFWGRVMTYNGWQTVFAIASQRLAAPLRRSFGTGCVTWQLCELLSEENTSSHPKLKNPCRDYLQGFFNFEAWR